MVQYEGKAAKKRHSLAMTSRRHCSDLLAGKGWGSVRFRIVRAGASDRRWVGNQKLSIMGNQPSAPAADAGVAPSTPDARHSLRQPPDGCDAPEPDVVVPRRPPPPPALGAPSASDPQTPPSSASANAYTRMRSAVRRSFSAASSSSSQLQRPIPASSHTPNLGLNGANSVVGIAMRKRSSVGVRSASKLEPAPVLAPTLRPVVEDTVFAGSEMHRETVSPPVAPACEPDIESPLLQLDRAFDRDPASLTPLFANDLVTTEDWSSTNIAEPGSAVVGPDVPRSNVVQNHLVMQELALQNDTDNDDAILGSPVNPNSLHPHESSYEHDTHLILVSLNTATSALEQPDSLSLPPLVQELAEFTESGEPDTLFVEDPVPVSAPELLTTRDARVQDDSCERVDPSASNESIYSESVPESMHINARELASVNVEWETPPSVPCIEVAWPNTALRTEDSLLVGIDADPDILQQFSEPEAQALHFGTGPVVSEVIEARFTDIDANDHVPIGIEMNFEEVMQQHAEPEIQPLSLDAELQGQEVVPPALPDVDSDYNVPVGIDLDLDELMRLHAEPVAQPLSLGDELANHWAPEDPLPANADSDYNIAVGIDVDIDALLHEHTDPIEQLSSLGDELYRHEGPVATRSQPTNADSDYNIPIGIDIDLDELTRLHAEAESTPFSLGDEFRRAAASNISDSEAFGIPLPSSTEQANEALLQVQADLDAAMDASEPPNLENVPSSFMQRAASIDLGAGRAALLDDLLRASASGDVLSERVLTEELLERNGEEFEAAPSLRDETGEERNLRRSNSEDQVEVGEGREGDQAAANRSRPVSMVVVVQHEFPARPSSASVATPGTAENAIQDSAESEALTQDHAQDQAETGDSQHQQQERQQAPQEQRLRLLVMMLGPDGLPHVLEITGPAARFAAMPNFPPELLARDTERRDQGPSSPAAGLLGSQPSPTGEGPGNEVPMGGQDYDALLRLAEMIGPARPRYAHKDDVLEQLPVIKYVHVPESVSQDQDEPILEDLLQTASGEMVSARDQIKGLLGETKQKCTVCLMDYEEADDLRILKCKHGFHADCIDQWLTSNVNNCPICRSPGVTMTREPEQQAPPPQARQMGGPPPAFILEILRRIMMARPPRRGSQVESDDADENDALSHDQIPEANSTGAQESEVDTPNTTPEDTSEARNASPGSEDSDDDPDRSEIQQMARNFVNAALAPLIASMVLGIPPSAIRPPSIRSAQPPQPGIQSQTSANAERRNDRTEEDANSGREEPPQGPPVVQPPSLARSQSEPVTRRTPPARESQSAPSIEENSVPLPSAMNISRTVGSINGRPMFGPVPPSTPMNLGDVFAQVAMQHFMRHHAQQEHEHLHGLRQQYPPDVESALGRNSEEESRGMDTMDSVEESEDLEEAIEALGALLGLTGESVDPESNEEGNHLSNVEEGERRGNDDDRWEDI